MKRIAYIQNNYITNVSIAEDSYILPSDGSQMLESDAIKQGYEWDVQEENNSNTFLIQPENIRLATGRDDEAEFSKLTLLLNLNLQQGKVLNTTPIIIWDYNKQPHTITVSRFLEIIADYGMYCYMNRS